MKKLLLAAVALCLGTATFAQSNKDLSNVDIRKANIKDIRHTEATDFNLSMTGWEKPTVPQSSAMRDASVIPLGSSYNIYGFILNGPSPVVYNSDVNSVAFTHRQNAGEPGGSGIISYDYSIDGGATWDGSNKQITPNLATPAGYTINGNRYPSGTIWNPAGNTDPNNAFFVGMGPALHTDPVYGNGWGFEYVASSPLVFDAASVNEDYHTNADSTVFHPYAPTPHPDGSIYYLSVSLNTDVDPAPDNNRLYYLTKLEYNAGTFDRSVVETFMLDYTGLQDNGASAWSLAFSPDGTVGYAVIAGADAGQAYPGYRPIVFKSTDSGASWTRQADYDFSSDNPANDTLTSFLVPTDQGVTLPFFSDFDLTVDKDGMLHMFAQMSGQSTTAPDSLGFSWIGLGVTEMYHFISDGAAWEMNRVDTWWNEDGTIGTIAVGARTQISRTDDGDKVFMTWTWTDTLATGLTTNDAPDGYGMGYDVCFGTRTAIKNLTAGSGGDFQAYYMTSSPTTMVTGTAHDYQIPLVYSVPTADDLAQLDYWYVHEAGFDEADFTGDVCDVSVKNVAGANTDFSIFPNPTQGTLNVDLTAFDNAVEIDVIDVLGNKVTSLTNQIGNVTIELNAANGVYFVRVHTAEGTQTQKFTVIK